MVRLFQILTGVLLGGIVAGVALLIFGQGDPGDSAGWSGAPLGMDAPAPEFTLLAHDGRTVELEDFRDRVTVLFFGFTNCPDVCPGTMASLARAKEQLGAAGDDLEVLFVTVDPDRDTPDRLRSYLANFDPEFLGLTGSEAVIREVATSYGAFFQRRDPDPDGASAPEEGSAHADHSEDLPAESYLVDHSGRTFVIDRNGTLVLTFQPWLDGDGMAQDLARLLAQ